MKSKSAPLNIGITGASGLLGRTLLPALKARGHHCFRFVRKRTNNPDDVHWDPKTGAVDELPGLDVVIHLAGASIGSGRWSAARKKVLRDSRIMATSKLMATLKAHPNCPAAFVSASAIGFFGDQGDAVLDEDAPCGEGFLASLVVDWENASQAEHSSDFRVANLRFGIILSKEGGALERMLPPFKAGVAGPMGSGQQWMSWVTLEDAVSAIVFATEDADLCGPINVVSPNPVRNSDFAKALGHLLNRPAILPTPKVALKMLLGGQMAEELLFFSTRVHPKKLLETGFEFQHPHLEEGLRQAL